MCIVCHYKGNNVLVTDAVRSAEHLGGDPSCIRNGVCVDCRQDGVVTTHVCNELGSLLPVTNNARWIDKLCPNCGAEPKTLCFTRGFDSFGPKTPTRKAIPCAARRRVK